MNFRAIVIAALVFSMTNVLQAQNASDSLTEKSDIKLYGNLYHQHHDFFDKAFSFQGLEVGLITNQNLLLGFYGSCFVTNLETKINNSLQFIWIGQGGLNVGYIFKTSKRVQPGIQLNSGVFSLRTDDNKFGLFKTNRTKFRLNGLVISPQIFGELKITNWFKIRTGLSYNFYSYKDHSVVNNSDLNHISFTFGLVLISK